MGNDDRLINALKAIRTTLKAILIVLTITATIALVMLIKMLYTGPDGQYVWLAITIILTMTCASGIHKTIE